MSFQATDWVMEQAPMLDPNSNLVLMSIAQRASELGLASYPSMSTIAGHWGLSVRTVMRKLRQLESAGLIVRGDQSEAEHLTTPGKRPIVYNLGPEAQAYLLERKRKKDEAERKRMHGMSHMTP